MTSVSIPERVQSDLDGRALPSRAARRRINLGGVYLDKVDLPESLARIEQFVRDGARHQIVTVNLDFLSIARRDPAFRDTLNRADLAVADGMPLVWLSHLASDALPERVTGVTLVDECCRIAAGVRRGVFLLGAAPGVADAAARVLEARYPSLHIAGTYSPPMGPLSTAEDAHIVRTINRAEPAFLFVALGAPRQDLWIRANLHRLDVSVAMGIGCVLDLLAGALNRAPDWMQRSGLEWAYRLQQEPSRLWRRYLLNDTPMLGHLLLSLLRGEPDTVAAPT